jgi:hypothetical protein
LLALILSVSIEGKFENLRAAQQGNARTLKDTSELAREIS